MHKTEGNGISINSIRYCLQILAYRKNTSAMQINVNDVMTSIIAFPCPGFGEMLLFE